MNVIQVGLAVETTEEETKRAKLTNIQLQVSSIIILLSLLQQT